MKKKYKIVYGSYFEFKLVRRTRVRYTMYLLNFPIPRVLASMALSIQYVQTELCFICLEHIPIHVSHDPFFPCTSYGGGPP